MNNEKRAFSRSSSRILLYSDHVTVEWSGQAASVFKGKKNGKLYLTTHRLIFLNGNRTNEMRSFSFPYILLSEIGIEQPVFGPNCIKAKVQAQPNGNWEGEATFKITFKHGGAIEFGRTLHEAAYLATRNVNRAAAPPPYEPSQPGLYNAPPSAYAPPPQALIIIYYPTDTFPDRPPPEDVYVSNASPTYPGINPTDQYQSYSRTGGGGGYVPPGGAYSQAVTPYQGGYPSTGGYMQQGGYPQAPSYVPQQGAYSQPPTSYYPTPQQGACTQPPPYSQTAPGYTLYSQPPSSSPQHGGRSQATAGASPQHGGRSQAAADASLQHGGRTQAAAGSSPQQDGRSPQAPSSSPPQQGGNNQSGGYRLGGGNNPPPYRGVAGQTVPDRSRENTSASRNPSFHRRTRCNIM